MRVEVAFSKSLIQSRPGWLMIPEAIFRKFLWVEVEAVVKELVMLKARAIFSLAAARRWRVSCGFETPAKEKLMIDFWPLSQVLTSCFSGR